MATEEINKYIQKRYDRWLDYASYHCSCAGIGDEAIDVLNEVLLDLLQKDDVKLLGMLNKKSGQYTELDYYILRMIKLNATSNTAPYRHKYKPIPVDENVNYTQLDFIPDEEFEEIDRPHEILQKTRQVREIFDSLSLSDYARKVFIWRFFCGEMFQDWPGEEKEKELFDVYYKIVDMIKQKLSGSTLF